MSHKERLALLKIRKGIILSLSSSLIFLFSLFIGKVNVFAFFFSGFNTSFLQILNTLPSLSEFVTLILGLIIDSIGLSSIYDGFEDLQNLGIQMDFGVDNSLKTLLSHIFIIIALLSGFLSIGFYIAFGFIGILALTYSGVLFGLGLKDLGYEYNVKNNIIGANIIISSFIIGFIAVFEGYGISGFYKQYAIYSFYLGITSFFLYFLGNFIYLTGMNIILSRGKKKENYIDILIQGLPVHTVKVQVDRSLIDVPVGTPKRVQGSEVVFCPQLINNVYYIPDHHVFNGKKVTVNYLPGTPNYANFPKCYVKFEITNYIGPWTLIVDNTSFKIDRDQAFILLDNKMMTYWEIMPISSYVPSPKSGNAFRGDVVKVSFIIPQQTPIVISTQQPSSSSTSLTQWNPKTWVGMSLYGYDVIDVIGEGGNGYVLSARNGNSLYALKVLKFEQTQGSTKTMSRLSFDSLFSEGENLKNLSKNPRFVQIFGIYVDLNNIRRIMNGDLNIYKNFPPTIVMEFMGGGNATSLFQDKFVYSQYWPLIVKEIIKEVAEGLLFLHSSGYVHLDIKPENIFFTDRLGDSPFEVYQNIKGKVKIGDLGSAVKIGGKVTQFTPAYCSPEQLEAVLFDGKAIPAMDVFSLGMTAYTMITLQRNPIADILDQAAYEYMNGNVIKAKDLIQNAKNTLLTIQLPSNVPKEFQEVILKSTNPDPMKRITAKDIISILH